jgi:hypothetical protein
VPYGTDSRLDAFQAINCLATIIRSLRDNKRSVGVHIFEATSQAARSIEDEDDENEHD